MHLQYIQYMLLVLLNVYFVFPIVFVVSYMCRMLYVVCILHILSILDGFKIHKFMDNSLAYLSFFNWHLFYDSNYLHVVFCYRNNMLYIFVSSICFIL